MKTTQRLLLCLVFVLAVVHSLYTTTRIRQLEARLRVEEVRLQMTKANLRAQGITYAFDDSFMKYFGPRGVEAVTKALQQRAAVPDEILRELGQPQPGLRYDIYRTPHDGADGDPKTRPLLLF